MKIRKKYQGVLPDNKIVNTESNSQTDTYSCDYINNMTFPGGGGNLDELPVGTVIHFDGEEIPEGWSEIESDDVDDTNASIVGTILYESTEGSNQNLTLSEAMSNFEYVDITYGIATHKFTKRIPGDTPSFTLDRWIVVDGLVYTRMTTYNVTDNIISVNQFALKYDSDKQVITESADASPLAIFKIVGYRQAVGENIANDKGEYYYNTFTNDEHLIGQWADGNLLYRKVFVLSGSSGDVSIDITDLNTSTPFIDFSHSFIAYTGYRIPLNRYAGSTNWITACINYTSSAQKIEIQFGDTFKTVSKTVVVVLEYTKKSN